LPNLKYNFFLEPAINKELILWCREFMMMPINPLISNEINKKKRMSKENIKLVFETLANMGLGFIKNTKASNKITVNYFIKKEPSTDDITLVEKLDRININIQEYLNSYTENSLLNHSVYNNSSVESSQSSSLQHKIGDLSIDDITDQEKSQEKILNQEQALIQDEIHKSKYVNTKLKKQDITKNTPLLPRKSLRNKY